MILTASTFKKSDNASSQVTLRSENSIIGDYVLYRMGQPIKDVFVIFGDQSSDLDSNLSSDELTQGSMILSHSSFSREWENEDDEYWNKYL